MTKIEIIARYLLIALALFAVAAIAIEANHSMTELNKGLDAISNHIVNQSR